MTVRDMVNAIRDDVRDGDLTPTQAGEYASRLSALLGNIAEEIRDADMAFNAVFAKCLDEEAKANRAKIRAELTEEYRRKREAHDFHMVTLEMVRSLRKLTDAAIAEARLQR